MGEPIERIDPTSDLYVRNARSHLRAAIDELTSGVEVQPDDALREQMESTALMARSVENGLSGIIDMMRRNAPHEDSSATSENYPDEELGEQGAAITPDPSSVLANDSAE